MSVRVAGLVLAVALAGAGVSAAQPAEPGQPAETAGVALLYVESNVDGASGGHAALRIDALVYNFQFSPVARAVGESAAEVEGGERAGDAGLLVLVREPWERARFRYTVLENRPLHVARLPLSEADVARVRDHFDRTFLAQQRELDEVRSVDADVAHLEALSGGSAGVSLRGAGLLDPARREAPAAARLRERIARRLGADFLPGARARAMAAWEALPIVGRDGEISPGRLRRSRELLGEALALRALVEGWDLAPEALVDDPGGAPLEPGERAELQRFAARLEERVLALLSSPRPDRSFPLLLTTARWLAVERSLASGRWVLLDPLPRAAPGLSPQQLSRRRDELVAAAALARQAWMEERRARLATALDEISLHQLEQAAARTRDLERAVSDGETLRLVPVARLPARARSVSVERAAASREGLATALARERARRSRLRGALAERYGYDLISDNCVHALADGLTAALGRDTSLDALGGRRDPSTGLGFVPAVFFERVQAGLADSRVERIAPWRERRLADLYVEGPRALVYLRESNRISAQVYRYRDADGSFLFFTSDVLWPRPLYGVANLLWAVGDGVVGLVTAPFDRGWRLSRAARGALFSAPELLFLNIRKGTFDAAGLRDPHARRALGR